MDIVNFKIMSYNNNKNMKNLCERICIVGNYIIFKSAILKLIGLMKLNRIKQLE